MGDCPVAARPLRHSSHFLQIAEEPAFRLAGVFSRSPKYFCPAWAFATRESIRFNVYKPLGLVYVKTMTFVHFQLKRR